MRHTLHLAAFLSISIAAAAHAQITSPDKLVAHPPDPAHRERTTATDDQQWLWQYTLPAPDGNKQALLLNPRFADLLQDNLKAPQSMWGIGIPLAEAAQQFLAGAGSVTSTDNRHLTLTGCVANPEDPDDLAAPRCTQHGLLFADLGSTQPLLVFAALRWTEQSKSPTEPGAPYNLWIFPSRAVDPQHLPSALKISLAAFIGSSCSAPSIASTLVVDPNGIAHIIGALDAGITPPICTPNTGNKS